MKIVRVIIIVFASIIWGIHFFLMFYMYFISTFFFFSEYYEMAYVRPFHSIALLTIVSFMLLLFAIMKRNIFKEKIYNILIKSFALFIGLLFFYLSGQYIVVGTASYTQNKEQLTSHFYIKEQFSLFTIRSKKINNNVHDNQSNPEVLSFLIDELNRPFRDSFFTREFQLDNKEKFVVLKGLGAAFNLKDLAQSASLLAYCKGNGEISPRELE